MAASCQATVGNSYTTTGDANNARLKRLLAERIQELRIKKPRWGYKRICRRLRSEGCLVSHKKVERMLARARLHAPA